MNGNKTDKSRKKESSKEEATKERHMYNLKRKNKRIIWIMN
jgi:hypothetical protein